MKVLAVSYDGPQGEQVCGLLFLVEGLFLKYDPDRLLWDSPDGLSQQKNYRQSLTELDDDIARDLLDQPGAIKDYHHVEVARVLKDQL